MTEPIKVESEVVSDDLKDMIKKIETKEVTHA